MKQMNAEVGEEFPIEVDIMHALEDFLDAYDDHAEMVVTEAIANAMDVKATQIDIKLGGDMDERTWISFYNNGPAMNEQEFKKYHVLAKSSKTKGKGIGFAGIGAKVYLAAWPNTVIHTETSDGKTAYASDMFVKDNTLKAKYLKPIIKKPGTLYKIKLKQADYDHLVAEINYMISNIFDPAISNGLKIQVSRKHIEPWKPKSTFEEEFKIKINKMVFNTILRVTNDELSDKKSYIQYHVTGKIITRKKPEWQYEIKPKFQKRIHAYVDATPIADRLNLNKTGFKSGLKVGSIFKEVHSQIFSMLKRNGFVENREPKNWESNSLTKFFDKLFKDPKYEFLNPDAKGGRGTGKGGTGNDSTGGTSGRNGKTGSNEPTKPRGGGGLSIGYVTPDNDGRDGWLDPETNKLMINMNHPLYIKYEQSIPARNQLVCRILTSVLIKNSLQKKHMDAHKALELQTELTTLARDATF